ncbi:MAG: LON peptidase substrate-binding domain-containing protein, partial [Salinivirgaceae bacterium]|nr:LON peptidase substrate-binding domain-containing protein [Salinivirgaceae bacterium]
MTFDDLNNEDEEMMSLESPGAYPIINDDQTPLEFDESTPLPILTLRNAVLFPGVIIPIAVGREVSRKLIEDVKKGDGILGAVMQKKVNIDDPGFDDLHKYGTMAVILKVFEMPDNSITVVLQGKNRFELQQMVTSKPYLTAIVKKSEEKVPNAREFEALASTVKDAALSLLKNAGDFKNELTFAIKNIEDKRFLINFVASSSNLKPDEKQTLLNASKYKDRALALLEYLNKEVQLSQLKNDIQGKVKTDIDRQQREFFLNQQIKTLQDELGGDPNQKEVE